MGKKLTKQQYAKHQKQHRIIVGLSVVVIAVLAGLVFAFIIIPKITTDARLHRINEIYSSIELPKNIYHNREDVFGDKRPYSYDLSRSRSSEKTFVIAKTVTETFTDMDSAIRKAGYTPFEEVYPGSTSKEYHYKTDKGEYIRLNVSSKLRNDAASNELLMNGDFSDAFYKIDPNVGPSTVILKVNLDDNNE